MSDWYNDDENDNGPKALRDALKKAQDDLKARDARIAELESSNADLTGKLKTTSLRDALSDAGVDPKYARFAERDGVEPTAEAVKQWVEESKDVYAFLAPKTTTVVNDDADEDGDDEDELDPELVAAVQAGQALESAGRPGGSNSVIETLAGTDSSQFKSEADIFAYFKKLGAPVPGE